jgi:hypothetical protein
MNPPIKACIIYHRENKQLNEWKSTAGMSVKCSQGVQTKGIWPGHKSDSRRH